MKKSISIIALCLILAAPVGCNKEEETTTTPSLSGLSISCENTTSKSVPTYIAVGDELTFTADVSKLYVSDGSEELGTVGLYWQVGSDYKDTLTRNIKVQNPPLTFRFDATGKYAIVCYAYSDKGYYNASASTNTRVIDPETSLTGLSGERAAGGAYRTVSLNGLLWQAENLYEENTGASYEDSPVVDSVLGRYYTWTQAQTACPEGWRLPTAAEWDALGEEAGRLMANAFFLEERMWPINIQFEINNETGFNAIPAGYRDNTAGYYAQAGYGEYALFWTADEDGDKAEYRYIFGKNPQIQKGKGDKNTLALSVRCVK
ncbi:MAG: hypothetical protein II171_07165 [Bacteroidales bacterium]|nr:hypothetical protein [Bacteroidales bacterium]